MNRTIASRLTKPARHPRLLIAIDVDLAAWRASVEKLTLKETGEFVRSLVRAQSSKRPNREQRMLLAVFTRNPDGEVTA